MFHLPLFLAQICVVLLVARGVGALGKRIGQPQVVGEMLAGLLLGPSALGLLSPKGYAALFPTDGVHFINALSQLGLVLYMFLVGMELDLGTLRVRGRQVLVVSTAGIALPMLAGGGLAYFLYAPFSTPQTPFFVFALFLGCAMSVTAFPVLARILTERNLASTPFGNLTLACAAVADVIAWGMLAVIVALAHGAGNAPLLVVTTLVGLAVFLGVMYFFVRPVLRRLWERFRRDDGTVGPDVLALLVVLVLLSALATELLQVHAIFGAFVAGLIMPQEQALRQELRARLEDLMVVLFLPLFFAYTGIRTNVGLIRQPSDWGMTLLIIGVALLGKLGGSTLAAYATGIRGRSAWALGILMNSRGLMELVLLAIGLQYHIISPTLFTMMVLMALVTTMMTTPLLARCPPEASDLA